VVLVVAVMPLDQTTQQMVVLEVQILAVAEELVVTLVALAVLVVLVVLEL
jgi:hypothetical protein